jgi:protein-disulfide reductase (glutathione)
MLLIVLLCVVLPAVSEGNELSRGWGDEIEWRIFQEGLEESQSRNKPMMVLFHKSWCGACKALKPRFADSQEIRELSHNFVMVNVQDEEEPTDSKYSPDGGYIPRILFLSTFSRPPELYCIGRCILIIQKCNVLEMHSYSALLQRQMAQLS